MENEYEESSIDLHQKKRAKIEPYIDYDDLSGFYNMKDAINVTVDQLISEVNKNGEDIFLTQEALNRYKRNIPNSEDINMITEDSKTHPQTPKDSIKQVNQFNNLGSQSQISNLGESFNDNESFDDNESFKDNELKKSIITTPSNSTNMRNPNLTQESIYTITSNITPPRNTMIIQRDLNNKLKGKIKKIQAIFNNQQPELPSKETMDFFFNEYVENNEQNVKGPDSIKIANPEKCFTEIGVDQMNLFNVLDANNMCYLWRDKGRDRRMFGISGELSIAGLTIMAMKTTLAIVSSREYIENIQNKYKKITWPNSTIYKNNYKELFNGAFINVNSKSVENRDSLDNVNCKNLTILMLNVMEEIKNNYFDLNLDNKKTDPIDLNFLKESYQLLEKIILIKSSLDVSQANGLTELVQFKNFCLFNSYDYSAVLNTPHCPVMASNKIKNYQSINYIYDDLAIFKFCYFVNTPKKEIFALINPKLNQIYNLMKDNGFRNEQNYDYYDIDSRWNDRFKNVMNSVIENKLVYQHLFELSLKEISAGFEFKKKLYEQISKLFLNYNVQRGTLNFKEITSNSRDIRAHDYANSAIRCFGISIYIKKKICDYLNIDFNGSLENELVILENLDDLTTNKPLEIDKIVKSILSDESKKLKEEYELINQGNNLSQKKEQYKKFLLEKNYEPLVAYNVNFKNLYYLMCCQNSHDFEQSQEIDGLKKCLVFEQVLKKEDETGENHDMVHLLNKPIFIRENPQNEDVGTTYPPFKNYELNENTMGVVDLCQKFGGVNQIINGILFETTITEADAAHASLGFYTKIVHTHKDGKLYYNNIELANVYSGDFQGKYDKDEELETYIVSFKGLNRLIKFNISATTALPMIKYLISDEVKNQIDEKINIIKLYNQDLGNKIEIEFNNLITSLTGFLNGIDPKKAKKMNANQVFNYCNPLIRKFFLSVNTALEIFIENNTQNCYINNIIGLVNDIGNQIYRVVYEDKDKLYITSQEAVEKAAPESNIKTRGKRGGGKDDYECQTGFIENEIQVNLFRGKFGSYIDVVNGKFVFKEIQTEEELKNIEMRLGIIDNNIKESTVPNTTPIKPNNPFKPPFQSPTSVEELNLSPTEKKQRINGEINRGINGDINEGINGEINGGKTIKRRRRIKRKTRRIKNKHKHRKTVKRMKKRSKLTKVRKHKQ